jgi:hypothetical protein
VPTRASSPRVPRKAPKVLRMTRAQIVNQSLAVQYVEVSAAGVAAVLAALPDRLPNGFDCSVISNGSDYTINVYGRTGSETALGDWLGQLSALQDIAAAE